MPPITDALGGNENIFSAATGLISAPQIQSLFPPTKIPAQYNVTDGTAYEMGLQFKSAKDGQIQSIRYWKAAGETGAHVGKIWSSSGQLLASVTFTNETTAGWQEQTLASPLTIQANTTYTVSVNANSYYVATVDELAAPLTKGALSTVLGVYGSPGTRPITQAFRNSNYYRDVVLVTAGDPNNQLGAVNLGGAAIENQTLTATATDGDGITSGSAIFYQWQQSSDNGITWSNIVGETDKTLRLDDVYIGKQTRVKVSYTDALNHPETVFSSATTAVVNVNDAGHNLLKGSATTGHALTANIADEDGLSGVTIAYQWQQSSDNGATWSNITGATNRTLALDTTLLSKQVRAEAIYTDAHNTAEDIFSLGVGVADKNPIVLENEKTGTTAWKITDLATNNEIAGYASATSVNKGEALPIKVSLAQAGQYQIDVYRLGYYGGTGGRLVTSSGSLNGSAQAGPSIDSATRLVEYHWGTSYTLNVGNDWTSGLYMVKLTDITTGKESQIPFTVRDDSRPAEVGFQDSATTAEAYNNYGGYNLYGSTVPGGQAAYKVSFDRPLAQTNNTDAYNGMLTWEYNMARWMESQGYDVSYYSNIDVSINPLQLYSQNTFLSVGHDEYWSMEMRNNVEQARDNGTNLGFFSANTAYWRVRFEPSSTGEANRVMVAYKNNWALDPMAQNDLSEATTVFRSPILNRPENALLGVMYIGDYGSRVYDGFNFVVNNSSDPYYANTGLQNGDTLQGLVGYEWDAVVNNGFTPSGLVTLSQSPVSPVGGLPSLPPGTNIYISNAARYTAASGAKVFAAGSIQWMWGLDSDNVTNPRTDPRAQQVAVNVLADMGAKPQTPSPNIVV